MISFSYTVSLTFQSRRLVYFDAMLNFMKSTMNTDIRQHILDTAQDIIARKGFTAVGLSEILQSANVPKGSFYHYFPSKDVFGQALLESYFNGYMLELDVLQGDAGVSASQRLLNYLAHWLETQSTSDADGKCLAVKLAAEVSDLSEPMRVVLCNGTEQVVARLTNVMCEAIVDGSLPAGTNAQDMATMLYHLWLGACLRAKITRDRKPLDAALNTTRILLSQSSS